MPTCIRCTLFKPMHRIINFFLPIHQPNRGIFPSLMVTHTRNSCSAFTHPRCTHAAVNTHTLWTHTEQWAVIYAAAPGEQLRARCLSQGHLSRGIEGGESAVHSPPHLQFLPDRDSISQPFNPESDSLTIRPRLPHVPQVRNSYCWTFWNSKHCESCKS